MNILGMFFYFSKIKVLLYMYIFKNKLCIVLKLTLEHIKNKNFYFFPEKGCDIRTITS